MKNTLKTLAAVLALGFLSSCAITIPWSISDAEVGDKVGRSKTGVIFGFIYTNGNYSVNEAIANGGLKEGVAVIDIKYKTILGLFNTQEIIVYGK